MVQQKEAVLLELHHGDIYIERKSKAKVDDQRLTGLVSDIREENGLEPLLFSKTWQ